MLRQAVFSMGKNLLDRKIGLLGVGKPANLYHHESEPLFVIDRGLFFCTKAKCFTPVPD